MPKYRVFTISKPDRLVVDFEKSDLDFNINNFSNYFVLKTRRSINSKGQTRIVFDLKKPFEVKKFRIFKIDGKYYLAIDLTPKSVVKHTSGDASKSFLFKAGSDPIGGLIDKKAVGVKYSNIGNITKKTSAKSVVKKKVRIVKKPVIVIDAGHGGKDPGTIGKFARSKEKYVVLGYAKELRKQLNSTGKYRVYLTRDKDYFIPLRGRVSKARKVKADLFISLHADASPNRKTQGLSIYTLSETSSDKESAMLAKKENKSDIVGGADFSGASGDILNILINLSQRSTMNESAKFAEMAIREVRRHKIKTLQNTHRFAGFRVLTAPDVPSVLIELGYLSNKSEEKKLNSSWHRKKVCKALVSSIGKYFR
ncbi:MAG: N-acetylmuramoyl-L-alanine amidase [Lentimonas sp.]|jgi:N-acetylmuramoyl-L-alanine amidase